MKKSQSSTGVTGAVVAPEVRYHPTIKTKTTADGRGGKPGSRHKKVNQNQAAAGLGPVPPVSPDRTKPKRVQRAAAGRTRGRSPNPAPPGEAPRLEPVPVVLGNQLDECLVKEVEVLTRGQRTNKEWFAWRKNRITASLAPSIVRSRFVNGRSRVLPSSYLAALRGEALRYETRAMKWGITMEEEAVRRYQALKSDLLGRQVTVRGCGLFIDARRPWLAASPDGVVTGGAKGEWLLEVKCPHKHRHKRVRDACKEDKNFCLREEPQPDGSLSYSLKASHSYFTQIQCQLAVAGLQHADLAVFTLEETVIVPVTFDPELWKDTLSKLEKFYTEAYPLLDTRPHAAAMMTEM